MDSANRYFAEHGIAKISSYKILQSEIEQLTSWQNELYEELKEKRSEVKRLQIIKDNMNNYDTIDLCECYEPLEYLPKEILRAWKREGEPVPEPYYGIEPDGDMYFYIGNTRIKVSEHFNDHGKTINELLEDA